MLLYHIKNIYYDRGAMKSHFLIKMFKKSKVLTLSQVSKAHGCSIRTVQRQFAELSVLRSYNKNSQYYTLPAIPKFNVHGIWPYRDILFSKHGDLRQTVKHMILASEDGLSANEIGDIVNLLPTQIIHAPLSRCGRYFSRKTRRRLYLFFQ
jgi:transcriptional antiterminator